MSLWRLVKNCSMLEFCWIGGDQVDGVWNSGGVYGVSCEPKYSESLIFLLNVRKSTLSSEVLTLRVAGQNFKPLLSSLT